RQVRRRGVSWSFPSPAFCKCCHGRLASRRAVRSVEQRRKSRQRKPSKRLKRQQPERKEKYRERQCRANRKQHHKLSKPSTRHDMQRQRSQRSFLGLTPMHNTASAVISRWDLYGLMGETPALEAHTSATTVGNVLPVEPPSEGAAYSRSPSLG